jgi:hypothetical protein
MARWNKYVDENGSHFTDDSETEISFMRFSSNRAAIKLPRLSLSKRLQRSTIIRDWTQKSHQNNTNEEKKLLTKSFHLKGELPNIFKRTLETVFVLIWLKN